MTPIASHARALPAISLAPRRRPRRRSALGAALLALALVAAPAGTAFAAGSPLHEGPATAPAAVISPDVPVVVTLSPLFLGVTEAGGALPVSVTVQNASTRLLLPTTANLEIGRTPITDREVLAAWQAGVTDAPVGAMVQASTTVFDAIPLGESATSSMAINADSTQLAGLAPGVYPMRVTFGASSDAQVATSTFIVRDPDATARPFTVGIVVPVTAPAIGTGLLGAAALAQLTSPEGSLTAVLDAVEGTPAILAIDPAILAAIRVLGSSAPVSATQWIARLDALPNDRFATAFADGDLATTFAAQLSTPLGPTTLQPYMKPANFIPAPATEQLPETSPTPGAPMGSPSPTPDNTPSATPSTDPVDPTAPVYPSLEELLTVKGAHPGMAWPVTGTASDALVKRLTKVAGDAPAATLVSSANTTAGSNAKVVTARGTADGAPVLVYDSLVSAALRDAASVRDPFLRGAPLAAAAAQMALATARSTGPLLVTVDRGADRGRIDLTAAIAAITGTPGATPIDLDALLTASPVKAEIVDASTSPTRVAAAERLADTETSIAAFATILDDPALLTAPERASIAQLLGAEWLSAVWPKEVCVVAPVDGAGADETSEDAASSDDAAACLGPDGRWAEAIAGHEQASKTTLSSVGILPPSTTNLISADAKLQFWVRNDLPYPVNVVFVTSPGDLRLEVERTTPVTAQPSSNTRVEVPVIAKVGSGDVDLELELRSPTLQPIGSPVTAEVIVRADWEFIGIISLAVIVTGLLVVGLIRTVLNRRSRRGARAAAQASTSHEGSAAPEGSTAPEGDSNG